MQHSSTLRLATALGLIALAACGDDSPAATGGSGGELGVGGSDGGATAADGGTTGTGGDGGGAAGGCVPEDVLAALNAFLADFSAASGMIAGHPGSNEAAGFFLAPGLPEPPGVVATFAGLFMAPCSEPSKFVPYCETGRCSQLECTGRDTSWAFHFYLDGPVAADGFSISALDIDHRWAEGSTGTTFDFAMAATGPENRSWDATGAGLLDLDSASLELTFPGLLPGGAVLTYSETAAGDEGALIADGTTVALVNAAGQLEATGDCP